METLKDLKRHHELFFKNRQVVYVDGERVVLKESYGIKNVAYTDTEGEPCIRIYLLVTAWHPEEPYQCFVTHVWYKEFWETHLHPTNHDFKHRYRAEAIRAARAWIDKQHSK